MQIRIKDGVNLTFISTKQFKTIKITFSFKTKLKNRKELAYRMLLANMLETSSKEYPNFKKVSDELAKMYGATFGTSVAKHGYAHLLNFSITCVNDRFLKLNKTEPVILNDAFLFLKSMMLNPLIEDNGFEKETFELQKKNLIDFVKSLSDNKQDYAFNRLNEIYFENDLMKTRSIGKVSDLYKITKESLYQYYKEHIKNDEVEIVVSGDLNEKDVLYNIKKIGFTDRLADKFNIYYQQELKENVDEVFEVQKLSQSKLNLAYRLPVKYRSEDFYKVLVFNKLFGNSANSKLFKNVREKESLAYYANSEFVPFTQYLYVQTGIQSKNKDLVLKLIAKQLDELKDEDFSNEDFISVKNELKNAYISKKDNQASAINDALLSSLSEIKVNTPKFLNAIDSVSKKDIKTIANLTKLQSIFFLEGREDK